MVKYSKLELRVLIAPEKRIALSKLYEDENPNVSFSVWFENTFLKDVSL